MNAINELTVRQMLEKIAQATAIIAEMQALLPALKDVAPAEPVASAEPVPKAKKAKKAKKASPRTEDVVDVAAPAEVVATTEAKPKKPASGGTMAWHAFVAHVQEIQPSRFAELKKHSEVLHEAKAIRQEDEAGYKDFIDSWKANAIKTPESSPPSQTEDIVQVPLQKEKKKVAVGTMIWHSWIKHCKDTMPHIAGITSNAQRIQAIKALKDTDVTAYKTFSDEFKNSANLITVE